MRGSVERCKIGIGDIAVVKPHGVGAAGMPYVMNERGALVHSVFQSGSRPGTFAIIKFLNVLIFRYAVGGIAIVVVVADEQFEVIRTPGFRSVVQLFANQEWFFKFTQHWVLLVLNGFVHQGIELC